MYTAPYYWRFGEGVSPTSICKMVGRVLFLTITKKMEKLPKYNWWWIQTAKEKGWGKEKFVTTIGQYLKVNNKQAREKAGRLYDKYVMGI